MSDRPESVTEDADLEGKSRSGLTLEVLVVVLTVLTAWAAYLGTLADDKSAELELDAQRLLSESQRSEAEADRLVLYEWGVFDEYAVAEIQSTAERYWYDQLSPYVQNAIDNNVPPFDEGYFATVYESTFAGYANSETRFEQANAEGERALAYQGVLLTFAIGLSFAAWGGLSDEAKNSRSRTLFIVLASAALVIGFLEFVSV